MNTILFIVLCLALCLAVGLFYLYIPHYMKHPRRGGFQREREQVLLSHGIRDTSGREEFSHKVFMQFFREFNSATTWSTSTFALTAAILLKMNLETAPVLGLSIIAAMLVSFGFTIAKKSC